MGYFQAQGNQAKSHKSMKDVWFSPRKQSTKDLFLPSFSFSEEDIGGLRQKLALDGDDRSPGGDGVSGMGMAFCG
jgi:hypothetical protein